MSAMRKTRGVQKFWLPMLMEEILGITQPVFAIQSFSFGTLAGACGQRTWGEI
jgi:hypothetical protein